MNTGEKNTKGRTIFRGPRGGEYVLNGTRKIRSFKKAAAPAPVVAAHSGPGNTGQKNTKGRTIYRGPNGGEYVIGFGGRKIRKFRRAPAPVAAVPPGVAKKLAKFLKLSNTEYINKYGVLYNSQANPKTRLSYQNNNNARVRAFNRDPKFLIKQFIPYVGPNRSNEAFMKKLKLKYGKFHAIGTTLNGQSTDVRKKIYFNKQGNLYFISLNGRKIRMDGGTTNIQYHARDPKLLRKFKRLVGQYAPSYPRNAIPPASPSQAVARRSSPELLANMMNQIYIGGRGGNVNAGRYTKAEKNVLTGRLTMLIKHLKQQRDAKKMEAMQHRAILQAPGLTNTQKQTHRNQAAAANERVGYYDDSVRAYTRGLRAVKPLTGAVTPRARAMPNTPNRYTPAPANVENNAIYMPLNRPHLVVKTPGAGTIYLNPNTLTGFLKNSARVTVAPANLRDWLRMARRDFPNEPLFRHPLAAKNVTASHIRFSK